MPHLLHRGAIAAHVPKSQSLLPPPGSFPRQVLSTEERRSVLSRPCPPGVEPGSHLYRRTTQRHTIAELDTQPIEERMEAIKAAFVPHCVKYGPESVDWKNSCYMEVQTLQRTHSVCALCVVLPCTLAA